MSEREKGSQRETELTRETETDTEETETDKQIEYELYEIIMGHVNTLC